MNPDSTQIPYRIWTILIDLLRIGMFALCVCKFVVICFTRPFILASCSCKYLPVCLCSAAHKVGARNNDIVSNNNIDTLGTPKWTALLGVILSFQRCENVPIGTLFGTKTLTLADVVLNHLMLCVCVYFPYPAQAKLKFVFLFNSTALYLICFCCTSTKSTPTSFNLKLSHETISEFLNPSHSLSNCADFVFHFWIT